MVFTSSSTQKISPIDDGKKACATGVSVSVVPSSIEPLPPSKSSSGSRGLSSSSSLSSAALELFFDSAAHRLGARIPSRYRSRTVRSVISSWSPPAGPRRSLLTMDSSWTRKWYWERVGCDKLKPPPCIFERSDKTNKHLKGRFLNPQ